MNKIFERVFEEKELLQCRVNECVDKAQMAGEYNRKFEEFVWIYIASKLRQTNNLPKDYKKNQERIQYCIDTNNTFEVEPLREYGKILHRIMQELGIDVSRKLDTATSCPKLWEQLREGDEIVLLRDLGGATPKGTELLIGLNYESLNDRRVQIKGSYHNFEITKAEYYAYFFNPDWHDLKEGQKIVLVKYCEDVNKFTSLLVEHGGNPKGNHSARIPNSPFSMLFDKGKYLNHFLTP